MTSITDLNRRRFLALAIAGAGSCFLLNQCTYAEASPWRFFMPNEAQLLDALTEQIIPTDEWPGAKDAGVSNYIDKQLVGPLARFKIDYRKGLAAVQYSAYEKHQLSFESLEWDTQTRFLECMEAGKMEGEAWADGFDRHFFNLLRDHTMQGYYGSPKHGGNKDYISYKMIRLDYPHIIGRNIHKS